MIARLLVKFGERRKVFARRIADLPAALAAIGRMRDEFRAGGWTDAAVIGAWVDEDDRPDPRELAFLLELLPPGSES